MQNFIQEEMKIDCKFEIIDKVEGETYNEENSRIALRSLELLDIDLDQAVVDKYLKTKSEFLFF